MKSLVALGFQGFLILICVAIYAVLIQSVTISSDLAGSLWSILGYNILLVFALFKTMRFSDINYKLATNEDQQAIFDNWRKFLNFFDSSVYFELTFVKVTKDEVLFYENIRIKEKNDGFDDVRAEYSEMLNRQLEKGNNGLESEFLL